MCEQEICDVRTSDQKDKKDGAESHRNRPVQIGPHKQALKGLNHNRSFAIFHRRRLDQGRVDGLHSFAGLDYRGVSLETPINGEPMRFAR